MGGLPCAHNGGSVAIRDSTAAAQILRMDHSLMSADEMNHDFRLYSVLFLRHSGKSRQERNSGVALFESTFPGDFSEKERA
jgi:hypothetical protein